MPKRHGLLRHNDNKAPWYNTPWFLVGITDIFNALAYADFISDVTLQKQLISLEYHFRSVKVRLAHSLDLFQRNVSNLETFFNTAFETRLPEPGRTLQVNASIFAEAIMNYVNMFADDIARVIPFVLDSRQSHSVDGFGALKGLIQPKKGKGKYPNVKPLFDELDNLGSWWGLALKKGQGARQRLVHYTDIINIAAGGNVDEPVQVFYGISNPFTEGQTIDFIGNLKNILYGLCDWLDRLEQVLSAELAARASISNIAWSPIAARPGPDAWGIPGSAMRIPIEAPAGIIEIPEDFLYLPLCDGSASSKYQLKVVRFLHVFPTSDIGQNDA